MAAESIDQRSTEGLAALLSSLNAAGALSNGASSGTGERNVLKSITGPGTNVSPEAMGRLTQRLKELLGDFAVPAQEYLPVNEDGLPIVDFNEHLPVGTLEEASSEQPEPLLLKPPSMTPEERAERRRQRDAFLDMLEDEERQEELQERTKQEQDGTTIQKLRRDAKKLQEEEVNALLDQAPGERIASRAEGSAKPALIWMTKVTDAEDLRLKAEADWKAKGKSGEGKGKGKSVSFAGIVEDKEEEDFPKGPNPLQGSKRRTMKDEIVERMPPKRPSNPLSSPTPKKAVTLVTGPDSDDESDLDLGGDGSDQELPEDAEDSEVGIDEALHQREIALRYHQLRQRLDTGSKEDGWDKPEVPLDATLATPNKRPVSLTSRFMTPRISNKDIAAMIPEGIESEIKPARIVGGQIMSADGNESDEGISEAGKKMIGSLARDAPAGGITTQVYDIAKPLQEGTGSHLTPTNQPAVAKSASPVVVPAKRESPVLTEVREAGERVPKWRPKTASGAQRISRFKANRTAQGE